MSNKEFMIFCEYCKHIMLPEEAEYNPKWQDYHCPDCRHHAYKVDIR